MTNAGKDAEGLDHTLLYENVYSYSNKFGGLGKGIDIHIDQ